MNDIRTKPATGNKSDHVEGEPETPLTPVAPLVDFRNDILIGYVHHVRITAWLTGAENVADSWQLLKKSPQDPIDIYGPDCGVRELGLTWDDVAHTDFAKYLQQMYEYGYYGLHDLGLEVMEEGTGFTWMSAILMDMDKSIFLSEWSEGFGGEGRASIERCLEVAELANARLLMETGEPFSYPLCTKGKSYDGHGDALLIRQVALLAGMEEMTIRAAANPKRSNALQTITENGPTRVEFSVAKQWLQSKGRYVPIRYVNSGRNSRLAKRPFKSLDELFGSLQREVNWARSQQTANPNPAAEDILRYLTDRAALVAQGIVIDVDGERPLLLAPHFQETMAAILGVPLALLSLRIREVLARAELSTIERSLDQLTAARSPAEGAK